MQIDNSSTSSSIGYQTLSSLDNTSKFTIESWVNMKQPTDRNRIFNKYLDNDNRIELAVSNAGLFELIVSNGGNAYGYTANNIAKWNEWSHIAMVYDGTQSSNDTKLKLYINGVLIPLSYTATIPTTTSNLSSATTKKIGSMVGEMDEFRLWNSARTGIEIYDNMNRQLDGNESGLVAYYNFDERSGNGVIDRAGEDQNGTIEGDVTRLNFLGDGLKFDGNGDKVSTDVSLYDINKSNVTFTAWINPSVAMNDDRIIIDSLGVCGMYLPGGTSSSTFGGTIPINQWSHVSFVFDGGNRYAYLNGELKTTVATTCNINNNYTNNFRIGGLENTTSNDFNGQIAEVNVYKKSLTQSEIQKLMVSAPNITDANLIGYWPLNDGSGINVKNYKTQVNGTLLGNPIWLDTAPTIYGDTIYTDYGINSWQKLVVENNTTQPLFSYFSDTQISNFNTSTGLFLYKSTHGDNNLSFSETLSNPDLTLSITVNSLQDVISGGSTGTDGDDIILDNDQNDTFDGLDGNDTVVYQMAQSNYTVIKNSDGSYSITDSDFVHTDRLTNIEYISFSDGQNLLLADIANPSPALTLKVHGGAVQFDKNAIITLAPSFSETLNEFNVEFWFNPLTQTSGVQKILELGSDTYIYANFATKSIQIGTGGWDMWSASNSVTDNTWHHISVDFNGTSGTIYIDGVPSFSSATGGVPSTYDMNSTNYFIGSNSNSGSFMIDELRIWNSSRIQSEIQTNMNQQLDGNESGLMAYYNFDERVGTIVKDITNNGNDGNISGNITRLNFLGDSLKFDGVDDFVLTSQNFESNTSSFTINGWIKSDYVADTSFQYPIALTFDSTGITQYYFKISNNATDSFSFETIDTSSATKITNATVNLSQEFGKWHFFTGVVDREKQMQRFYLDGNLVSETALTNNLKTSTQTQRLTIGGQYVFSSNPPNITADFNGSVAEVSYWSKPLTQTEIRYLMNSAPHTNDSSLVGYWPLNDGSGSVAKDYSMNQNGGTLSGATWINTAPTVYGNTLYTDYGINSWQKLFVENNTTNPIFSLNGHDYAGELNSATGLFKYSSWGVSDILAPSTTNPVLSFNINVRSARSIIYDQNGTSGDDVLSLLSATTKVLDGGDGNDTLVMLDAQSNYTIVDNQDGNYTLYVNGTSVSVQLVNIETIDFSNNKNVEIASIAIIVNIAPSVTSTPITTVTVGQNYLYELNATDSNGNSLVWGGTTPSWLDMNVTATIPQIEESGIGDGTTYNVYGIDFDPNGNMYYVAPDKRVLYKKDINGTTTVFAGKVNTWDINGTGDGGVATSATFEKIWGVKYHRGSLYVTDKDGDRVRRINLTTNIISTYAIFSDGSDDKGVVDIAFDNEGNMYGASWDVFPNGKIIKVAPDGTQSDFVTNLDRPWGIDYYDGKLYVAFPDNHFVSEINITNGTSQIIAGTSGNKGSTGDEGNATSALLNLPMYVRVDTTGRVFIADRDNYKIRMIDTDGIIRTVAGSGTLDAPFDAVEGIAFYDNKIYVADRDNRSIYSFGLTTQLTGTPAFSDVGTYDVNLTVTDGVDAVVHTFSLTVENSTPSDISLSTYSVNENTPSGQTIASVSAVDNDTMYGDTHTFSLGCTISGNDDSSFAILGPNLSMNLIPDYETKNSYEICIRATDSIGAYFEKNVMISIVDLNDAPTISGTPSSSINEDSTYNFTPTANDVDSGDTKTFSIVNKPSWADFNTTTGQLRGTPTNSDVGITSDINITVTDSAGAKASLPLFTITVVNVNDAPVLTQPSNISKDEDFSDFNITLVATDIDSSNLIFNAISQDISKVTTSINGNILTIHSVPNANGIVTIDVNVTDGELSDTKSFDINISNVDDAVILDLIKISLDQDEYENFGSDDSITLTMPLFELNNNVDGEELQINQWMIDNANSYNIKTTSNFQNKIIDQLKTKESVSQNGNSFVTPTKEIKIVSEILLDAGIFTLGDDVEILFSNGAKGYEVVEKNGTSYLKYYLWNTIATDDLIKHFGFSTQVYKEKNITTTWTYIPLEGSKPLCNNFYKTELSTVCDQNNTIESVFNQADGVFKYNDFWSYWDKNGATYGFDRLGSISAYEGLILKSSATHTLHLPYNLVTNMNLKVGDFYKSGWYLVNIPFSMTITELTNEIASQGRTLAHVFKYNSTAWEIYATDDENYATIFPRITTLLNGDVVWIEVK